MSNNNDGDRVLGERNSIFKKFRFWGRKSRNRKMDLPQVQIAVTLDGGDDNDNDNHNDKEMEDVVKGTENVVVGGTTGDKQTFAVPTLPVVTVSTSFLGADLSSASGLMGPPKLNTVKKKRALVNPGKSMVEWMKIQQQLVAKGQGTVKGNLRKIGIDELASHNTFGDVWMAINDKVFDVSEYVKYHPGGVDEIMKGAGQDATVLYNQVHRWVNFESILRGNFLGYLVKDSTLSMALARIGSGTSGLPTTKFSEDDSSLYLEIESHLDEELGQESWTVGLLNRERLMLKVVVQPPKLWMTHLRLLQTLTDDKINVHYGNDFRKVLVTLRKPKRERWLKMGIPLPESNQILDSRVAVEDLYSATITRKKQLTHNTYLFTVVSTTAVIGVPIGFHVEIRLKDKASKPYTPIDLEPMTNTTTSDSEKDLCEKSSQELHFIIKIYPNGYFTSLLHTTIESSSGSETNVDIGCPKGSFDPLFLHSTDVLCFIAGGTGITPFVRLLQYLRKRRHSLPLRAIILMFFNESSKDIIWDEEWRKLSSQEPNWFHYFPVISKPELNDANTEWKGATGRISPELFERCVKGALSEVTELTKLRSKAMICGSYGFNAACKQAVKQQTALQIKDPSGIFIFNG